MNQQCSDCGMDFETSAQLANHKKKFCIGAQGSEEAIEKRLQELKGMQHNIDYSFDVTQAAAPVSSVAVSQAPRNNPVNQIAQPQPQPQPQYMPPPQAAAYPSVNAAPATGFHMAPQQIAYPPAPSQPQVQFIPQPTPYPFPVPMSQQFPQPQHHSAEQTQSIVEIIRRLENQVQRQDRLIDEETKRNDELTNQFKNDITRVQSIQNQQTFEHHNLAAYPSQQQQKPLTLEDSQEDALLERLDELEDYLATNPTKYQQMQNPTNLLGVEHPVTAFQSSPNMSPQPTLNMQVPSAPGFNFPPPHDPYYFNALSNPSGNRFLDDMERVYKLRQDVDRCDDLESEERAMVNLASQEYDTMKMLSTIPEHSELYKFKLEQYKQLSNARAKAEIYLQEQRLNRLNKNFELQVREQDRRNMHEDWMEQQRRMLFGQKVSDLKGDLSPTNLNASEDLKQPNDEDDWKMKPTTLLNSVNLDVEKLEKGSDMSINQPVDTKNEEEGTFNIFLDTVFNVPLDYKDCELCICLQRNGQVMQSYQPQVIKMKFFSPDSRSPDIQRIHFNAKQEFKGVQAPANLIAELRKFDPDVQQYIKSVAWTIFSLFDPAGDLNVGKWHAPMFLCPTKLSLNVETVAQEQGYSGLDLAIRIFKPQDLQQDNFNTQQAVITHYQLAHYHIDQLQNSLKTSKNIETPPKQDTPARPASVPLQVANVNLSKPHSKVSEQQTLTQISKQHTLSQQSKQSSRVSEQPPQASNQPSQQASRQPSLQQSRIERSQKSVSHSDQQLSSVEEVKQDEEPQQSTAPSPKVATQSPAHQKDPNYVNKGVKLYIHYARIAEQYDNLYIQCTAYTGKQIVTLQNAQSANWLTKEISVDEIFEINESDILEVTREGLNIKKGDNQSQKFNLIYPSNENNFWEENFYELAWRSNLQERLILLIQVLTKLNETGEIKAIGYTVHELTHEDGKLKFGTFSAPLLLPPISFRSIDKNPSPRLEAIVNFSVLDIESERQDAAQFIPNPQRQHTLTEFWRESEEDGIDIYIDTIRHFPENVSIVKIIAKVLDKDSRELIAPVEIFPRLRESNYQNQIFSAKVECRATQMLPTALLHISFVTIEATTLRQKLIGVSIFPIFINCQAKKPVLPSDNLDIEDQEIRCLHKGAYQLPIYSEIPKKSDELTYRNFLRMERIPTASCLIRVDYASIDFEGNFISINDPNPEVARLAYEAAPRYEESAYSTVYFLTTETERELFKYRYDRATDAPLREVLQAIAEVQGKEFQNDSDLLGYFKEQMAKDAESLQQLDLIFYSAYESKIGFRYNVTQMSGLKDQGDRIWQVLSSIIPSAQTAAFPFYFIDQDSRQDRFNDDDICLSNMALFRSSTMVLEIRTLSLNGPEGQAALQNVRAGRVDSSELTEYGFTVYPMTKIFQNRVYFSSGVHKLPIYKGAAPLKLTEILSKNTSIDPTALLQKMREDGDLTLLDSDYLMIKAYDSVRIGRDD